MKHKGSFHPYAAVTILFWSLAYVLTRETLEFFTPFSLGFLRYLIASVALLAVALITRMEPPRGKEILWFVASGGVGFFFYMIAFNQGQATVTAATGSVVIATVPVITAFFAGFIYRERLRAYQWVAIFIEFVGVAVLVLMEGAFSVNSGLVWLCLAALALSAYNLMQRKLTKDHSPLRVTTYSILMGTLMLGIFAPTAFRESAAAPPIQNFYLVVLGLLSSAVAYLAWAKAFSLAKQTSLVSNYMFITPFLTTLLGFLISKEVPDRATLVGGGIILVGVMIFNFAGRLGQTRKQSAN